MVKTITDLLTLVLGIALAAFLVKNYEGTVAVGKTLFGGFNSTVRTATFQNA